MRSIAKKFALSVGVLVIAVTTGGPALASETSTSSYSSAAAGQLSDWEFGGFFNTQQGCINEGNEYVRRGWASTYDCVPASPSGWALWYVPA